MSISERLAQDFLKQVNNLKEKKGEELTIGDIDGLFKHLKSDERDSLYEGIQGIAEKINLVKLEVFQPHPDQIVGDFIPDAHIELEAVVKAAEDATNSILDAVEVIQNLVANVDETVREGVLAEVTKIFEACNFQDITGQRINKVVTTLLDIDNTVNDLMDAIASSGQISISAKERVKTEEEKLLEGPQLDTPSQDEIDKLFADA